MKKCLECRIKIIIFWCCDNYADKQNTNYATGSTSRNLVIDPLRLYVILLYNNYVCWKEREADG